MAKGRMVVEGKEENEEEEEGGGKKTGEEGKGVYVQ